MKPALQRHTATAGSLAAARAIENLKEGTLEVAPLQSYARPPQNQTGSGGS